MHINSSPSFPRGIYRLIERSPARGDLVFSKPPDADIFRNAQANGYFKRGDYLLKKLAATMTNNCLVDGEVLLMSDYSPQSFDAR